MENIKNKIFYVNIKNENGMREVREAKIVELIVSPDNFYIINDELYSIKGDFRVNIEIAGLGIVDNTTFCENLVGQMFITKEAAFSQQQYNGGILHYHRIGYPFTLELYWGDIYVSDLNLSHDKCEIYQKVVNGSGTESKLHTNIYYWDGTRALKRSDDYKFRIDLLNNMVVEYRDGDIDKLGKLYNSYDACNADNQPKVFTFSDEGKKEEVDEEIEFKVTAKKSDIAKLKGMGLKITC